MDYLPIICQIFKMAFKKEAQARIKINNLLEKAGWRFFADPQNPAKPANIQLERIRSL